MINDKDIENALKEKNLVNGDMWAWGQTSSVLPGIVGGAVGGAIHGAVAPMVAFAYSPEGELIKLPFFANKFLWENAVRIPASAIKSMKFRREIFSLGLTCHLKIEYSSGAIENTQ